MQEDLLTIILYRTRSRHQMPEPKHQLTAQCEFFITELESRSAVNAGKAVAYARTDGVIRDTQTLSRRKVDTARPTGARTRT